MLLQFCVSSTALILHYSFVIYFLILVYIQFLWRYMAYNVLLCVALTNYRHLSNHQTVYKYTLYTWCILTRCSCMLYIDSGQIVLDMLDELLLCLVIVGSNGSGLLYTGQCTVAFSLTRHSTTPDWNCVWHVCTIYSLVVADLF